MYYSTEQNDNGQNKKSWKGVLIYYGFKELKKILSSVMGSSAYSDDIFVYFSAIQMLYPIIKRKGHGLTLSFSKKKYITIGKLSKR